MTTPRLGVLVGRACPPDLRDLLTELARRVRLVDAISPLDGGPPAAAVWFADVAPPPGMRIAAWFTEADQLRHPVVAGATACITPSAELAEGTGALLWPQPTVGEGARPVLAAVRRRIRQARGLLPDLIGGGNEHGWWWYGPDQHGRTPMIDVPAEAGDAVPAVAAAVVATGPAVARALAWAAPVVTDPASAAKVGAVAGMHLLVAADHDERLHLARALGTDEPAAARLGWAGRRLVEARMDPPRCALTLLRRLGVPSVSSAPGVADELDWLGTPADSPYRTRLAALARLPARRPEWVVSR